MRRILSLILIVCGCQAAQAEVMLLHRAGPICDPAVEACTLNLQINGEITENTPQQVQQLIDKTRTQAKSKNYFFAFLGLELNSPGGSVDAAMAIGRIIRKEVAGAFVPRGSVCLSACVLVLAGGSYRSFEGTVGIHRPYFPVPKEDVSADNIKATYQKMLQNIRAYLREMNVAEGLADAMLRINPENMRVLTTSELTQYGLTDVDPVAEETYDLQQAQSLGIDRQEYMRRKSLAEQECGGPTSQSTLCYRNIIKMGRVEHYDFSRFGRMPQQDQ